ncbi:MAG TPA: hypothetical protein VLT33_15030 [Labilithrix sp.]|nr:hypothetical protein [Labilithrix sp.]
MDRIIVRSAAVRLFFVVLIALVALAASAHAEPPAALRETTIAAALFTPTRVDDGLEWRVRWVLSPEAAQDLADGSSRVVRFAVPLGQDEALEKTWGITPVVEGGKVVGVALDRAGLTDGRVVTATLRQHLPRDRGGVVHLGAPVAVGSALQIIDADLGAGTRLELGAGRVLEKRVGYMAPPGASHAARAEARRLTGYEDHLSGAAIYVRGDDAKALGGLDATLETPGARGRGGVIGIGVAFGAIVLALFAAVRRLRHAASVERSDAILAAELDALAPADGAGGRR